VWNVSLSRQNLTQRRRKVISLRLPIAYLRRMIRMTLLAALLAAPAAATTQDDVLSASLLPGWQMESGAHMAAVELVLAPGWKTYWRSPGDAGIPPSFDWSGSKNVRSVRLHWPAPTVFHTNGLQTIGYHDRLVLPVEVTAIDTSQPVHLAAKIDLGICDQICLPASVSLSTDLIAPGAPDDLIRAALGQRAATASEAGVASITCTVDPIADGLRLTAKVHLPQQGIDEVVAFETADPSVWIAESTETRDGEALVAVTELVDRSGAPFALDRSGVTVTILADNGAVELRGCPAP
jgi:DsbC/DsbD-like thiol-disulfide interchange protein